MKEKLSEIKGALLTGVSYMLPFVIAGGILIALGFAIGGYDIPNSVEEYGNFASTIFWLGKKAFALMVPVLGAYVAYSIADKPGIAVGMVGGALADMQGSGFLGALIAGIIAGYLVNLLKKINLPMALKSLLPTLIIPIIGVGAIGLIMVYVIGTPLSALTTALTDMLNSLGTGNLVLLGIIQGCMLAFDMGGPCNKVAYAFALAAMGCRKLHADGSELYRQYGTSAGNRGCGTGRKKQIYKGGTCSGTGSVCRSIRYDHRIRHSVCGRKSTDGDSFPDGRLRSRLCIILCIRIDHACTAWRLVCTVRIE